MDTPSCIAKQGAVRALAAQTSVIRSTKVCLERAVIALPEINDSTQAKTAMFLCGELIKELDRTDPVYEQVGKLCSLIQTTCYDIYLYVWALRVSDDADKWDDNIHELASQVCNTMYEAVNVIRLEGFKCLLDQQQEAAELQEKLERLEGAA